MSQTVKALLEMREMVLSGALQPGERLYEVALSERIGISRTPLREALGRLEQEGLLERLRAGGFAVRKFSFGEVLDAIELRGVLEGMAARLAAERGGAPKILDQMRNTVERLDAVVRVGAESLDFSAYAELNGAFHADLSRLAGSDIVTREVERAARLPFASPNAFPGAQTNLPEIRRTLITAQNHHRDLLDAIEAREGARAEHLAREHARLARKNLQLVMKQDRDLIEQLPALALVVGQDGA